MVGLRRAGFDAERVRALKQAFRILYRSGLKLTDALARIEAEIPNADTLHLVEFIRGSKRGICRP
jgi:UDP-N-acetylglucosamine acyltransferase